ncbi:DUF1616 domain-containing protein [Haladaptatus cibarius]|uniref:DUF1616 domain-containing protein n=1 Tax=Haladaptatus cibarius TaxID=453847 RepID=UPI000679AABD|nr:DUF1616 domain-containing protein [Haladaptatus cibarius]
MSPASRLRQAAGSSIDLLFVCGFSVLAVVAPFTPLLREEPIRPLVTLPLLCFLPGYAVVAALFPTDGGGTTLRRDVVEEQLGGLERFVFAVGTSVLVVAGIALALTQVGIGIWATPVAVAVSTCTVIAAAIAAVRRRRVADRSEDESGWFSPRDWVAGIRRPEPDSGTRLDRRLNVVLVVLILASVGSIGFALAGLDETESYTELSLLDANGSAAGPADGQTVAAGDGSRRLFVGIENHENRRVQYTVVVQQQQVAADDPTTVRNRTSLDRLHTSLVDGERTRLDYSVPSSVTGRNHRLAFLLYEGDVPSTPTMQNAEQETHLWVTPSNKSGHRQQERA